jgi:hypothetical protein
MQEESPIIMTETHLLALIARLENLYGAGVNWYRLCHWDQEIAPNPVKALEALAAQGYLEAMPERSPGWYRLTTKGRASLHQPGSDSTNKSESASNTPALDT